MYWDIGDSPTVYLNQRRSTTTICCQPQKEEEENAFSSPASSKCERGRHTTFFLLHQWKQRLANVGWRKVRTLVFKDSFWWIWIYWDRNCQKKESDWERAKKTSPPFSNPFTLLCFALPTFLLPHSANKPFLVWKKTSLCFPPARRQKISLAMKPLPNISPILRHFLL